MDGNDGTQKIRARDSLTAVLKGSDGNIKLIKTVDNNK